MNAKRLTELPLLGSNQDSPDPESGVLPVTPRGSFLRRRGRPRRTLSILYSTRLFNPETAASLARSPLDHAR